LTHDGPIAIDHDLSFPTVPLRDFAATVSTNIVGQQKRVINGKSHDFAVDGVSSRNYYMPLVIDWEMYKVIMAIDLNELKNMCEGCGLTRHEIQAAMSRTDALKKQPKS
jgi:hypothetical protein